MYHSIFPQVRTVVTKRSVTPDPTTNQSVYATHSNTPPHYSKSPPSANPSPPITIPKKPTQSRTLRSAQPNPLPPPPSKLVRPKLQDREPEYAVPVKETGVDRGRQENIARGTAKPVSMFMQNAGKKPPDPPGNVPLYDKVNPDQPVVVEPLLPRQSADGNDTWAQFKFPILPMPDSNKQAEVDNHVYDEIVDEHVYDEIGDKYLPPVEWRKVSVMKEFIYKGCCKACEFFYAKMQANQLSKLTKLRFHEYTCISICNTFSVVIVIFLVLKVIFDLG